MRADGSDFVMQYYNLAGDDVLATPEHESYTESPLLSKSEQRQLAIWNATRQDYPQNACIPQLVAMQAASTPDAVALVAGDSMLTYAELTEAWS